MSSFREEKDVHYHRNIWIDEVYNIKLSFERMIIVEQMSHQSELSHQFSFSW